MFIYSYLQTVKNHGVGALITEHFLLSFYSFQSDMGTCATTSSCSVFLPRAKWFATEEPSGTVYVLSAIHHPVPLSRVHRICIMAGVCRSFVGILRVFQYLAILRSIRFSKISYSYV